MVIISIIKFLEITSALTIHNFEDLFSRPIRFNLPKQDVKPAWTAAYLDHPLIGREKSP